MNCCSIGRPLPADTAPATCARLKSSNKICRTNHGLCRLPQTFQPLVWMRMPEPSVRRWSGLLDEQDGDAELRRPPLFAQPHLDLCSDGARRRSRRSAHLVQGHRGGGARDARADDQHRVLADRQLPHRALVEAVKPAAAPSGCRVRECPLAWLRLDRSAAELATRGAMSATRSAARSVRSCA